MDLKDIRKWIDSSPIKEWKDFEKEKETDKIFEEKLTDYLNFFQLIVVLKNSGQIREIEIRQMFNYYLKLLKATEFIINDYLPANGYKELSLFLKDIKMINKIFVYGTLHDNPGNRYSKFLERNAQCMGMATKKGKLFNIGRYPGAVKSPNPDDTIKGYLYSVRDIEYLLNTLDEYEGYNKSSPRHSLFIRKKALVADKMSRKHWAWMYWYNKATNEKKEIDKGDFFSFKKVRNNQNRALPKAINI